MKKYKTKMQWNIFSGFEKLKKNKFLISQMVSQREYH